MCSLRSGSAIWRRKPKSGKAATGEYRTGLVRIALPVAAREVFLAAWQTLLWRLTEQNSPHFPAGQDEEIVHLRRMSL